MPILDERQTIEQCKKGDKKAYVALYNQHAGVMYAISYRYAKVKADADDILQEGFTKIFSKLDQYNFQGSFEGWMKRIIVNTALMYYRKKSEIVYNETWEEEDNKYVANDDVISDMSYQELLELVQELPFGCRTVFNLYAIEGYSHKEIGEELSISVGTSKSQLSEARKMLRKKIETRENMNNRRKPA